MADPLTYPWETKDPIVPFDWEADDELAFPWEVNDPIVPYAWEEQDAIDKPVSGFARGFFEKPEEKLPVLGQAIKGAKFLRVVGATKRLQQGYDYSKPISPEAMMPGAMGMKPALYASKQSDIKDIEDYLIDLERQYSTAGKAGQIISEMPAFAIDFMLTGGIQATGSAAAKTAIGKLLGRYATTTAGRATIAAGGFSAGAALRSIGMPTRAANAIIRRQAPQDIDIDNAGNVTIVGPVEKPWTSVYKGLGDHYIEIASEQAGEFIAPGISKYIRKTPFLGKALSRIQTRWLKLNPGKKASDFAKAVGTKTGFHGVLGEVGEEYLGDITRAITDVEHFGAGEDAEMLERVGAAVRTDTENLPAMFLAFAVPGVVTSQVSSQLQKMKDIDDKFKKHVDFVAGLEVNSPTQIETAEGALGFEEDFPMEQIEANRPAYEFDRPGISKYFTPKWLLNRMLGLETLLEDVDVAQMSLQLEQVHLNGWISHLIPKIKKEKGLARLPELLPEEAEREALLRPDDIGIEPVVAGMDLETVALSKKEEADVAGAAFLLDDGTVIKEANTHFELINKVPVGKKVVDSGFVDSAGNYLRRKDVIADADRTINVYKGIESGELYNEADLKEVVTEYGTRLVSEETGESAILDQEATEATRITKTIPIKVEDTSAHILFKKIGKDTDPIHIMRDLLDTYDDAPAFLNESETRIFNQVREVTRYLRKRANLVRARMGLPLIRDVKGYITHWMDRTANAVVAKDLPIHSGYLYKLMQGLPKIVKNPTAMRRQVRGMMEKYFSKDLGRLLRTMVTFDLKDIYLKQPYEAAWDELQALRAQRAIPDSTYKVAEQYLLYDIRKHAAPMDKAFNRTMKKPIDLLNKLLPAKAAIDDPARNIFSFMRRLGFMAGLGLRLKPAGRNLGQRLLLTDLYRTADYAKAQAVAFRLAKMPVIDHPITGEPIKIIDLIREQDWYKMSLRKFEDQVTTITGTEKVGLYLYSRTHVGNLFISNVEVSALTGYFDWQQMRNKSKDVKSLHFKNAVRFSKKTNVPVAELLTQDSDMMWNIREAVRRSQWEYFNTSMPTIYRSQFNRAMGMFQSWWMNYFFNHSREMVNQTITGRNSLGRLLTPGGRLRAVKGLGTITAIGKASKTLLGIEMLKYLFMPVPGYLPPIPSLIVGILEFFAADDDKERKRAWVKIKRGLKFWVPFSAFGRDLNKLLSGEYSFGDFIFYRPVEEKK